MLQQPLCWHFVCTHDTAQSITGRSPTLAWQLFGDYGLGTRMDAETSMCRKYKVAVRHENSVNSLQLVELFIFITETR